MKPLTEHSLVGFAPRALLALLAVALAAGCGQSPTVQPSAEPGAETPAVPAPPTPTATAVPPKVLSVCLAEEPASLYRYDGHAGEAKESVFAALYDGPFEVNADGAFAESILSAYPGRENAGISAVPTAVQPGDVVVDAYGELSVFKAGIFVRPSGCESSACAVTWESGEFQMDQTRVEFQLRPDALWSDGQPLSAQDAVFSYEIAGKAALPGGAWALDRTISFTAENEQTVVWLGVPGFFPRELAPFFWLPLPAHQLESLDPAALEQEPQAARAPLGWGAYRLTSWESSQSMVLERNPYYFGAAEDQPGFDQVRILFVPEREEALSKLADGSCDVLDKSYHLETLPKERLSALSASADLHWEDWQPVEQLVFGIQPASYDDGYAYWSDDRPDFFSEARTRLAVLACLDPQTLAEQVLADWLPDGSDLTRLQLPALNADPAALLNEVGWKDLDADPATPRTAQGITGINEGTALSLRLYTSQSALQQKTAALIVQKLGACDVGVDWQPLPLTELYAPGPEGVLFGRKFDLALVSWLPGSEPLCSLYSAKAVPSVANFWVGTNLAGYSDPAFEAACADAEQGDGLAPAYPAAALLPHLSLWVSRPGLAAQENQPWSHLESLKAE
ncbi:MAG: ABC transporter substrate-binding protein [Anaerolineaceae bacterium]